METALIKGWCPGALRPMESGDGLIVRLKLCGGVVLAPLAGRIAAWSRRWGNGQIDLTSRANLQLRGITTRSLPPLQDALACAGLLEGDAAGEAVRNVIASPLAGIDPDALLDARPLAAALEHRLAATADLYDLPAKFGFAIDDGGRHDLAGAPADVRFESTPTPAGAVLAIRLDGALGDRLGPCSPDHLTDAATRLARVFLDGRRDYGASIRRMRDLTAAIGAKEIARRAGFACVRAPYARAAAASPAEFLGVHALNKRPASPSEEKSLWLAFVGVGLPFGRISADELENLVKEAEDHGARELRLTPWRAILTPLPSMAMAHDFSVRLAAGGLILDPADPRRRVAACVGAPACARATTPIRADAARLAPFVGQAGGPEIVLHVSGCGKGCAHHRHAPFTFVGRDGQYDLVRDGVPTDAPLQRGLAVTEAENVLQKTLADRQALGAATRETCDHVDWRSHHKSLF